MLSVTNKMAIDAFLCHQFLVCSTLNNLTLVHHKYLIGMADGLEPVREKDAADGSYKIIFLGDGATAFRLELTWLRDHTEPYDLGEQEFHLAFTVEDYAGAFEKHKAMGCVCFENPAMGIYFIEDPDGYWIEIVPEKR